MARVGLPASIIKKYGVTKKAWRIYRRRHPKTNKRRRISNPKVKRVARRRRYTRKRRRRKRTIAVLPILGAVGTFAPVIPHIQIGDWEGAIRQAVESGTGYSIADGQWYPDRAIKGLMPLIVGVAAHKVCNMLGLNRVFANLPSPLNKLRL